MERFTRKKHQNGVGLGLCKVSDKEGKGGMKWAPIVWLEDIKKRETQREKTGMKQPSSEGTLRRCEAASIAPPEGEEVIEKGAGRELDFEKYYEKSRERRFARLGRYGGKL